MEAPSKYITRHLRENLFKHTSNQNLDEVKNVLEEIRRHGKHPADADLRVPNYGTTVLHWALQHGSKNIASYLIAEPEYSKLLATKCLGIFSPEVKPRSIMPKLQVVFSTDSDDIVAEGSVGLVTEVSEEKNRAKQVIMVNWGGGVMANYRCDDDRLRVLDNRPLGVTFRDYGCDGFDECLHSREEVRGYLWSCAECPNYDLCSNCYFSDKHEQTHQFIRFDTPACNGVRVPARSDAKEHKIKLKCEKYEGDQGNLGKLSQQKLMGRQSLFYRSSIMCYSAIDGNQVDISNIEKCYIDHLPKLSEYGEYQPELDDDYVCRITIRDFNLTVDTDLCCITNLSILAATGDTTLATNLLGHIDHTEQEQLLAHSERSMYDCIHIAVANGHYQFVELMLSKRIESMNYASRLHEWTPIMYAVRGERTDIVRLLLDREARQQSTKKCGKLLTVQDENGETPLSLAVEFGTCELVKLLLDVLGWKGSVNTVADYEEGCHMLSIAVMCRRTDMVTFLLDQGADCNQKDYYGSTALHCAPGNRDTEIIELLLARGADVDVEDVYGDTAILVASERNDLEAIRVLIKHGARLNHQNHQGMSVWSCIVNKGEDVIREMLNLYRALNDGYNIASDAGAKDFPIVFRENQNPFFLAIRAKKYDVLELLCSNGADPHSADRDGNTVYHMAASEGQLEPLTKLAKYIQHDKVNKYGKTALHLAAKKKDIDIAVVEFLLKKSTKIKRGKNTMKLLLKAAEMGELVVIENIAKAYGQLRKSGTIHCKLEMRGECDNTALHFAAKKGQLKMMECLIKMDFDLRAVNKDGDRPFHAAMRSGSVLRVDDLIELFQRRGVNFEVNDKNKNTGETALHICARLGDWHHVEQLIQAGANLEIYDKKGNTALHVTVEASVRDPGKSCNYIQVLDVFMKSSAEWWRIRERQLDKLNKRKGTTSMKNQQHDGDEGFMLRYLEEMSGNESDERERDQMEDDERIEELGWVSRPAHQRVNSDVATKRRSDQPTRSAMLHLLWDVQNKDNLNVVSLAVSRGAVAVIDKLLDFPGVFRFQRVESHKYIEYDITFLTPETMNSVENMNVQSVGSDFKNHETETVINCDSVEIDSKCDSDSDSDVRETVSHKKSCLEWVVDMVEEDNSDEKWITAAKILDTNPFKILVENYRRGSRIIFTIVILAHIIHMVLFTMYVLPRNKPKPASSNSTGNLTSLGSDHTWFSLFLFWPTLSFLGLLIITFSDLAKLKCSARTSSFNCLDIFSMHKLCVKLAAASMPQLCIVAFVSLTTLWYIMLRFSFSYQLYLQISAAVFILGWLMTLYFAKSTEDLIFSVIFERIAFRDISRFAFMYTFILVGFGFAFHILFQQSPSIADDFSSPLHTLLATFNLMMGIASPLRDNFEKTYTDDGGTPAFVYCIYVLYVVIASVIMINLLIAMMTHSFEHCRQNASIIWRVRSLKLALSLIRIRQSIPFISRYPWSIAPYSISQEEYSANGGHFRWMLRVPIHLNEDDSSDRSEKLDAILDAVQRIEQRLDSQIDSPIGRFNNEQVNNLTEPEKNVQH